MCLSQVSGTLTFVNRIYSGCVCRGWRKQAVSSVSPESCESCSVIVSRAVSFTNNEYRSLPLVIMRQHIVSSVQALCKYGTARTEFWVAVIDLLKLQHPSVINLLTEGGRISENIHFRGPLLWSSGQSSWLQIRRPGFDSRHYQKKKK
jgi:hypothetical protein